MFLLVSDVPKLLNDLARSFYQFTLIRFHGLVFALSNMNLLIMSSSCLAVFSSQTLGLFKKFGLWSICRDCNVS